MEVPMLETMMEANQVWHMDQRIASYSDRIVDTCDAWEREP